MFSLFDLQKAFIEAAFIPFFSILDAVTDMYVKSAIKQFEVNSKQVK